MFSFLPLYLFVSTFPCYCYNFSYQLFLLDWTFFPNLMLFNELDDNTDLTSIVLMQFCVLFLFFQWSSLSRILLDKGTGLLIREEQETEKMPQETKSNPIFTSPSKNLRGLKALVSNSVEASHTEDIFNDNELAQRKAEEAGIFYLNKNPSNIKRKSKGLLISSINAKNKNLCSSLYSKFPEKVMSWSHNNLIFKRERRGIERMKRFYAASWCCAKWGWSMVWKMI